MPIVVIDDAGEAKQHRARQSNGERVARTCYSTASRRGHLRKPMESLRIESAVKQFLAERFDIPPERLTEHASMRELGLDSMMMLEVMLEVEDRFGIKLKDLSMPANPTLRDVVDLAQRNLQNP
jgi:acyl carrier protein